MRNFKLISFALLLFLFPSIVNADSDIVADDSRVKSYLIGDFDNESILYEKNSDEPRPIASMSKIMTYLLTMEDIDSGNISMETKVKVNSKSAELNAPGFSSLGLEEGMEISVKKLLEGLMVVSGNDCARQLAYVVGGNEKKFANLMNKKAKELGLKTQKYYNASGITTDDGDQNTSSAKDLFKLSRYVIKKYPEVLKITKLTELDFSDIGIGRRETVIPLLGQLDGLDGLKTGTTDEAGYCFTSTVDMSKLDEDDEFRTIGVVMGADSHEVRESVTLDLVYYVSKYFNSQLVLDKNSPYTDVKMNSVKAGYINLYPKKNLNLVVGVDKRPVSKVNVANNIKLPIKKGDVLGNVEITVDGNSYDEKLIAGKDEKEASQFSRVLRAFSDVCNLILDCFIAG